MFGKSCDNKDLDISQMYGSTDDIVSKALILNDDLMNDPYIKKHVYKSINKKIKDSYIGKLVVDGNFQTMISDPYALMEHVFKLPVIGILNRNEYYSYYWKEKFIDVVAAMRAPLTWQSEVNLLNLKTSKRTDEWFKYITSSIIYNIHGNDNMLHADADADGDQVLTTNSQEIISGAMGGLPVTYEKRSAEKNIIQYEKLYKSDIQAFNPKIGFITNTSSTLDVILVLVEKKYGKHSKEYNAVLNRLKICRKSQGDTIDSAKGIVVKDFPKWWTQFIKITDDMSEEEKDFYSLSNRIVVDANTRPYFFKYLYSDYNTRHENRLSCFNERSIRLFEKDIYSLMESDVSGEDVDYLLNDYYNKFGFIDNDASMNLVCHYMETSVKRIRQENFQINDSVSLLLMSNKFRINQEKLKEIDNLYKFYIKEKRKFVKNIAKSFNFGDKYQNIEQIFKQLRLESEKISSSAQELANLAVELCYFKNKNYDKDFVWKVFYSGLLENIIENKKEKCEFPILSDDGDIYYLGKMYKNKEVDLFDF